MHKFVYCIRKLDAMSNHIVKVQDAFLVMFYPNESEACSDAQDAF